MIIKKEYTKISKQNQVTRLEFNYNQLMKPIHKGGKRYTFSQPNFKGLIKQIFGK